MAEAYDPIVESIRIPAWLRRGLEAGIFGGLLAVLDVLAYRWAPFGSGIAALPGGFAGAIVLALPVFAMGVFAVGYPVIMAATRSDALLGAITAALVAADLLLLFTLATDLRVALRGGAQILPIGMLAAALAGPAAVTGLVGSQLFTPLGFGRRAGLIATGAATFVAVPILLVVVPLLS